jgi:hypothetical protein
MKRLKHLKWLFGPLALFVLALPLAADPMTYTYTGNDFETVFGPSYTTSDFVSGFFTVASPLPTSLLFSNNNITPTAYSFTDGVQTFSSVSPPAEVTFDIATDGSGNIIEWDITLGTGPPLSDSVSTFSGGGDQGQMISAGTFGNNLGEPGTWTASGATASTPEPEGLGLFTIGAIALGLVRRKFVQSKA